MLTIKHISTMLVLAGALKVWQSGEDAISTDLNANFNHIHSKMVGGHGARLVDADVNASANISCNKLNLTNCGGTNSALPKAWGAVLISCTSSPCTISAGTGISSITRSATGIYTATLSYTATDTSYLTNVASGLYKTACTATPTSTTQFSIRCTDLATPSDADAAFSVIVMDDN